MPEKYVTLKEAQIEVGENTLKIQKIKVIKENKIKFMFAWYKKGRSEPERRPLDLNEENLLELLKEAINNKVFPPNFIQKLRISLKAKDFFLMKEFQVIKSTPYCDLLNEVQVVDGEYRYTIQRIRVKEKNEIEIRFAYYENNRFAPDQLKVDEEKLLKLFKDAITYEVFSLNFVQKLINFLSQRITK